MIWGITHPVETHVGLGRGKNGARVDKNKTEIVHLRHRRDFCADAVTGLLPTGETGEAIRPVLCGAPRGSRWTFVEVAEESTPAAFAFPYAWEGVLVCVTCATMAKKEHEKGTCI